MRMQIIDYQISEPEAVKYANNVSERRNDHINIVAIHFKYFFDKDIYSSCN